MILHVFHRDTRIPDTHTHTTRYAYATQFTIPALQVANAALVRSEAAVADERTRGKECVGDFSCATHDKKVLELLQQLAKGRA